MKVLKFGGTSVGTTESIRQVIDIILDNQKKKTPQAVVFSAMGGCTNLLIDMGTKASKGDEVYKEGLKKFESRHFEVITNLVDVKAQSKVFANVKMVLNELEDLLHGIFLLKELSARTNDLLVSYGERLSTYIIFEILRAYDIEVEFLDARTVVKTDRAFGCARVDVKATNTNITEYFKKHKATQLITGFIATSHENETTTLGRGGSDYTASIFGAALDADEIEIWTDVDGMMTADPRMVKKALRLSDVSYIEAMELSHFGAKVIYPPTLQPAFAKKIPIWIKNTFNPTFIGTVISDKSKKSVYPIKGISSINDVALLNVQGSGMVGEAGISGRLFSALAHHEISVILITQASSEYSICFAVEPKDAEKAKSVIEREFEVEFFNKKIDKIIILREVSIVAIVGENMKQTPGIAAKMFSAFGKNGVNVVAIAQGSSEYNLSVVIDKKHLAKALNSLHEAFFLAGTKSLNIFLVGVGLIGNTLLKQMRAHADYLLQKSQLKLYVVAIADSKKMLFDDDLLDKEDWKSLIKDGESMDMEKFIAKMKELDYANSVFVDCTSSKDVVKHYLSIVQSAVSIVTPNKLANSGKYKDYKALQEATNRHHVSFLYETNVGAGLPVINTLKDLMNSGDEILKIEAVLSGTLSFIFNSYKSGTQFSSIVKEAKAKGFTEPDPRDDLSGLDVARKLLILARETGMEIDLEDIEVEDILPPSCKKAKSVDDFFKELEKEDAFFEKKRAEAEKAGGVLRFIATLEKGKAFIALRTVDGSHPFYSLSGSDNIISFTSKRYNDRPLVVKGPGAGAEVTAAGVFAEIISISKGMA